MARLITPKALPCTTYNVNKSARVDEESTLFAWSSYYYVEHVTHSSALVAKVSVYCSVSSSRRIALRIPGIMNLWTKNLDA